MSFIGKRRSQRNAALLHDFGAFKRELQHSGLINSIDADSVGDDDNDADNDANSRPHRHHLNELDTLQLIPVLLDQLQAGKIEASDRRMLNSLYGPLWQLMLDEVAARRQAVPGDPVLADLLRALQQLEANGGRWPAVGGRNRGGSAAAVRKDKRFVNLWNRTDGGDEEPAQRLLKLVAILIHANRGSESHG